MPSAAVFRARQSTTGRYSCVLKDETGATLSALQLSTLTLTLYNTSSRAIINSRDHVSVLNSNGGSLDASGNFAMIFTDLDNVVIDETLDSEPHTALFEWTYGTKKGSHEVTVRVLNIIKVGTV